MMPEPLTVDRLLACGFEEVGCWSASQQRIDPPRDLPAQRGVYAFALGDQVVYVGLASRSVKQRLGFYARPGPSQRTNIRLNAMIAELIRQGQTVHILIAHPGDSEWRGLRLSGPEGLEAALIEDFDLPWNVRGSSSPIDPDSASQHGDGRRVHGSTPQAILDFVAANPKCTELQIAKGIFGPSAVQQRANQYCRRLVAEGKLRRLQTRPARYLVI
jgi:hypothetical protein